MNLDGLLRYLRQWGFWLLACIVSLVHFHSGEILSRKLLSLDDETFILPLKGMDFTTYLTKWLPGRDHYAFPLRDMTFWLDFELSQLLGFQTFWITNVLFFLATLWALKKMLQLVFPQNEGLRWTLLTIIALHPINVEVLQWLSIRKHLLSALFMAFGTLSVLRVSTTNKTPRFRDWMKWAGYYLAGLLCFPTGLLWIFWPLFHFRKHLMAKRQRALLLLGVAIGLAGAVYKLVVGLNPDYGKAAGKLFAGSSLLDALELAFRALGRGFFNLLFPFQIVPYYEAQHSFNVLGGLLFIVATVYLIWRLMAAKQHKSLALSFFAAETLIFTPQLFVILNFKGFVWADRYLYAPLPYFMIGAALLFLSEGQKKKKQVIQVAIWKPIIIFTLALIYTSISVNEVKYWSDEYTLMDHCFQKEGSTKCLILSMEGALEKSGCDGLLAYAEKGKKIYAQKTSDYHRVFRLHFPFYVSMCTAITTKLSVRAKTQALSQMRSQYKAPLTVAFAEVLLALQQKQTERAYEIAKNNYLIAQGALNLTYKTASYYRGQAEALCQVVSETEDCAARLKAFVHATRYYYPRPDLISWAKRQSMALFRYRKQ